MLGAHDDLPAHVGSCLLVRVNADSALHDQEVAVVFELDRFDYYTLEYRPEDVTKHLEGLSLFQLGPVST